MTRLSEIFILEAARFLALFNLFQIRTIEFEKIVENVNISICSDESSLKDMALALASHFDHWVRIKHRCLNLSLPKSSKLIVLLLWIYNFSYIRVNENLPELLIPADLVSEFSDKVTLWGLTNIHPEFLSDSQNLICGVLTAAKTRNFINFFDNFALIQHRPKFISLLGCVNFRDAPNQIHAILMHCTGAELKYLKKFCSLDSVITMAIQQSINLRFTPILIQLRDGSVPVALDLINAENSQAGDFENPAPPVIIIDNEDAPDSPLPDLAPIPPLPIFPESPAESSEAGDITSEGQIF